MVLEISEQVVIRVGSGLVTVPAHAVVSDFIARAAGAPAVITRRAVPRIGEHWDEQGGLYAGVMRSENGPDRHLITPADALPEKAAWGGAGKDEPGAVSEVDGRANTMALIASPNEHPAAQMAAAFHVGPHSDFYLPARHELRLLYLQLAVLKESEWVWSSTQYSARNAWCQGFDVGSQFNGSKDDTGRVRVVRSLPIQ